MSRLVEQARTYVDVPYRHRGRSRKGIDCAGVPWCSYNDLEMPLPDLERYGRAPHNDGLMTAVEAALGTPIWTGGIGEVVPRELLQPGDVVVIRFEREPHHLGIIGDSKRFGLSLIHADGSPGVSRVVELGLQAPDPCIPASGHYQRLICAVFRKPA